MGSFGSSFSTSTSACSPLQCRGATPCSHLTGWREHGWNSAMKAHSNESWAVQACRTPPGHPSSCGSPEAAALSDSRSIKTSKECCPDCHGRDWHTRPVGPHARFRSRKPEAR